MIPEHHLQLQRSIPVNMFMGIIVTANNPVNYIIIKLSGIMPLCILLPRPLDEGIAVGSLNDFRHDKPKRI